MEVSGGSEETFFFNQLWLHDEYFSFVCYFTNPMMQLPNELPNYIQYDGILPHPVPQVEVNPDGCHAVTLSDTSFI